MGSVPMLSCTPEVDVVIPTVGRSTLIAAVESARSQLGARVHVYVVLDDASQKHFTETLLSGQYDVELVTNSHRMGGGFSRNRGAMLGNSPYVGFLDDDDTWEPTKVVSQVEGMERLGCSWAYSAANLYRGRSSAVVPRRLQRSSESVLSYAASRPRIRFGDTLVQTSTLMVRRTVMSCVAWDESLQRHQDWDYACQLESVCGRGYFDTRALSNIFQQPAMSSVSRNVDWRKSQRFLSKNSSQMSARSRSDFYWAVMVRKAMVSRDLSVFARRPSGWYRVHLAAFLLGLGGLIEGAGK